MSTLAGKRILLGVTGGIAAYKAAELVRLLRAEGANVRVVMTEAATAFVTPLTFQALSDNPVHLRLLDATEESAMGHISLARWAEAILVAPATADFIARLRLGLADDLLSSLCLASDAPIFLAPAMNRLMWESAATQDNVRLLKERGVRLLGPTAGEQACGEVGQGRMVEPSDLRDELKAALQNGALAGLSVLVSAGPTREPIDPIRYISNRSSGKMGYAIAQVAQEAGAAVTLVSGPVALPAPRVQAVVNVESAGEMYRAVISRAPHHDIYIGVAAVTDYAPTVAANSKIKKHADETIIHLTKTPDVLSAVAELEHRPFTVGFAAETDRLEQYARQKLTTKAIDMIAANWVGKSSGGFESDENALQVYWSEGERYLAMAPKTELARQLIDLIAERYHAKHSA
jgi:phosphopantothenoylcysteine decarboxylase/phosphopantothenate--cysteine ligase